MNLENPVIEFETTNGKTRLIEESILDIVGKEGAEVDLKGAQEDIRVAREHFGSRKFPLLIDTRPTKSVTREAREFYCSDKHENTALAVGLLVKSSVSIFIAKLIINFSNPVTPTKMFTSREQALSWLRTFLPRNKMKSQNLALIPSNRPVKSMRICL